MKIALMQTDIQWEDKEKNLKKAEQLITKASQELCNVAVFPEMFSTGFSMDAEKIAEEESGMLIERLCSLAYKHRISLITGIAVKKQDSFENRAYVFNAQGKIEGYYVKNYGFSYSGEDKVYQSGREQLICEIDDTSSSVFICYDLRFPELFRKVARSVSVIYVIANWPESRINQWDALLKARAIENQCFIVAVNRKGSDGNGLIYNGHSQVISPMGEDVTLSSLYGECRIFDIDEGETAFVRQRFPFLKDYKIAPGS